ncbi:hypothetical protein [Streptomyces sp. NPDC002550]
MIGAPKSNVEPSFSWLARQRISGAEAAGLAQGGVGRLVFTLQRRRGRRVWWDLVSMPEMNRFGSRRTLVRFEDDWHDFLCREDEQLGLGEIRAGDKG